MNYYPLYIVLAFLPSLVWLSFYLKKDKHPEPNSMVLKIFFWGMAITIPAILLEWLLIWLINPQLSFSDVFGQAAISSFFKFALSATLIPALAEEYLKYSVVKHKVLKDQEFDEPIDAMLYCIIAALGFAAVENLIILIRSPILPLGQALNIIFFRFLGATFLHALASGLVGYYLAQGLFNLKQKRKLIGLGLLIAILFHTCYNYLILLISGQTNPVYQILLILLVFLLLAGGALWVGFSFRWLRKKHGLCKLN